MSRARGRALLLVVSLLTAPALGERPAHAADDASAVAAELPVAAMSLQPAQMRTQDFPDLRTINSGLVTDVSSDQAPTGGGLYVSLFARSSGDQGKYSAKLRPLPDRSVALSLNRLDDTGGESALRSELPVPGLVLPVGDRVRVRLRVTGSSPTLLQSRAWLAGTDEPSSWQATATDSTPGLQNAAPLGVAAYLSGSATQSPVVVRFERVRRWTWPVEPEPEPEPEPSGRPTSSAGSAPVGAARYPVPAGAVFVSNDGDDDAAGSQASPWRTVAHALATAPAGGTVVLRAGTYHESVTIQGGRGLTLQSAPGEPVWFDGSTRLSSWASDGGVWRSDGWTARFDHSPTYTPGAPDSTTPGWSFVNSAHPLAAHPEQVFVDGAAQIQVGSRAEVGPGRFYVDTTSSQLYLGTDPRGRAVQASDLSTALTVRGAGSVLRGFGVRRYATAVPQMGTVLALAPDVLLENLVVSDNATEGIFVGGIGQGTRDVLRHVTAERNGLLGIASAYADGLRLEGVRATANNTEHFNLSPVSGGVKITRARGIAVVDSVLSDNEGPGLWMDESVYDVSVAGNDLVGNVGHGLSFEISAKGTFVDNLVTGNGGNGMKINNATDVAIWNNTVVDNRSQPIWLVQDSRVASDLSTPGHDPRQQLPDPSVPWLLGPVVVRNNVLGLTSSNCLLCVQDSALYRSASTIGVSADSNVYVRPDPARPNWLVTWPSGAADPAVYTGLEAFRGGTGQEPRGVEFTGVAAVAADGTPLPPLLAVQAGAATPIPSAVAAISGHQPGDRHLGAWLG